MTVLVGDSVCRRSAAYDMLVLPVTVVTLLRQCPVVVPVFLLQMLIGSSGVGMNLKFVGALKGGEVQIVIIDVLKVPVRLTLRWVVLCVRLDLLAGSRTCRHTEVSWRV